MKKILSFVFMAIISTLLLSGCSEYRPDEDERFFKIGESYRVIELSDKEPETIEEYGIESLMIPMKDVFTFELSVSEMFAENSLFFQNPNEINKDGVIAVYECLNLSGYNLTKDLYDCDFTDIFTYNQKIQLGSTTKIKVDLSGKPEFTVYGHVADVTKYTFRFEDRSSKDGTKTGEGTFEVLLSGISYVSTFVVYE